MEEAKRNPYPPDDKDAMSAAAAAATLDGILESGALALTRAEKTAIRMGADALERDLRAGKGGAGPC